MADHDETSDPQAERQFSARSGPAPTTASSAATQPTIAATVAASSSSSAQTSVPTAHSSSSSAAAPLRQPAAAGVAGEAATVKAGGHQHTLSFSPRSNPAFSDPDYYPDREDVDDVFSNPDTAELEARSDATGSTSPDRAMSPVLSSPDSRGRSGFAYSPHADVPVEDESKTNDRLPAAVALHHRPSHESQMTQNTATPVLDDGGRGWGSTSVTPTTSLIGGARSPSLGSSPTARRASMHPRPVSAHQALLFSDSNTTPIPAANDLPMDPSEASSVSTLFAHPPGPSLPSSSRGSPALSAIRLALSSSPTFSASAGMGASKSASAAGSPSYERSGYHWSVAGDSWAQQSPLSRSSSRGPLASAAPGVSGTRTTPATRPSSPDRSKTIMPPLVVPEHMSTPAKTTAGSSRGSAGGPADFSSSPTSSYSPVSGGASSRSFGGVGWGLGLSSPAGHSLRNARGSVDAGTSDASRHLPPTLEGMHSASPLPASESSIFERDIEHRDARHVLSKSEAVDVAIPPVLDDAVEAIIEGGDQPLEIVAPLPSVSATPHALSALALSAHSLASSPSLGGPIAQSPMVATSSPRSASGALQAGPAATAADEPPLGSIAAQIAEGLGTPRSHAGDASCTAPPSAAATAGDHPIERRSRGVYSPSSGASSTYDAGKSRSPGPNPASVQQILEGASGLPGSPLAGRSLFSHTPRDRSPAPQLVAQSRGAHTVATTSHSRAGSVSQQGTAAANGATPQATALPSLPLPNPFRSDSPSVLKHVQQPSSGSALGFMEGGSATPAPVTMSLDGAIIPSSESAIHEMSLDAMADALADAGSDSEFSPSPIVPRKASVVAASLPPPSLAFLRRDTNATITAANVGSYSHEAGSADGASGLQGEDDLDMPGGFPGGTPTKSTASPETRRLSFFSYADIINDTPAELVDFEEVVSREMASGFSDDAHLASSGGGVGSGKIARSPRASFGGAGLAKPFPAPEDSNAMGGDQSGFVAGSPSILGRRLVGQNAASSSEEGWAPGRRASLRTAQ